MRLYRVCPTKYAKAPLSGEGPFLFGTRWSSPGTRLACASTSAALAQIEFLGHLVERDEITVPLTMIIADVPQDVGIRLLDRAPPRWRRTPSPLSLRRVGDLWVASKGSCVLIVSSIHLPQSLKGTEQNALINPTHPDFGRIRVKRIRFRFDPRLL